jgi:antitoxin ParD1/3/4
MPTRNVVLTDYQAELIEELVSSGRYQNASEVLRDGLRMVETRAAEDKARLKMLRDAARLGVADIDAKRYQDFDSPASLQKFLGSITNEAIARKAAKPRSK